MMKFIGQLLLFFFARHGLRLVKAPKAIGLVSRSNSPLAMKYCLHIGGGGESEVAPVLQHSLAR